ncbi:putative Histone-lysine N-methyltransferase [Rhodotorula taiwanensis]|uniref:Histone-lysine N-methyltransferase, H3 lysine-36 specific n=1 Tax=Rhodotorula taiwanensis TaxID=741276 RepID=A0A2S5B467_9BASI|nr:putative Histone-lysine N-methyltransferase [Rhodotorula taiwanensis]
MSLDPFALPPSSNSQAEATRTAADLPPPPPDRTDSKPEDLATFTAAASTSSHSHFEHASASNGHAHAGENGTTDSNGLTAADVVDEDRKPDLPPPFPFASTSKAVLDAPEPTSADGPLSPRGGASRRSASAAASGSRNGDHGPGSRVGSVKSGSSTPKLEGIGDDDDVKPITTTTTTTPRAKGKKKKVEESVPQFIGDLPLAEEEAARTFEELEFSTYFSKSLGDVKYYEAEEAQCDCSYNPNWPLDEQACGVHSNCMNRLMQMECLAGDCRCGRHCQNQRFQRRQYAPIEIVKTEKKGFGVRAGADIPADAFVYEYVGEVIGPTPFQRKMKEYANEGIKHFYFMALDKDVFIDATKRGGKGRFLNHSCNPNCYVAKWTVGKKMRMGIFTKRDIKKDEELTFNYNVDRYGHVAQECYCGEAICEGYIGGKTQTDLGGMDDLYIDALGIAEEVAALGLKGTKKKKGKKLDEDFTPTLHPIQPDEVPKVSAAIRQALQTRRILEKLLTRVHMTTDEDVQRDLLRLHGLNLMNNILREYEKDIHIITLDLEILGRWKLQTRNKIESSKIEESVQKCLALEDDKVKTLANELLQSWADLQLGYRIPKALLDAEEASDRKRVSDFDLHQLSKRARLDDSDSEVKPQRPELQFAGNTTEAIRLPEGWDAHYDRIRDATLFINIYTGAQQWDQPTRPARKPEPVAPRYAAPIDANEIIAQAERAAQAAAEAEAKRIAEEKAAVEAERKEKEEQRKQEKEEKARAQKEKKVMGLFSGVVVATMSKYRKEFEPEAFKKRAREVSEILVEKEKKRPSYATDAYDSLAPEKEAKVRSFVKDWTKKLLERKKTGRSSSSSTPRKKPSSTSAKTDIDQTLSVNGNGAALVGVDTPDSGPSPAP